MGHRLRGRVAWVLAQVLDVVADPRGLSRGLVRGTRTVLTLALPPVPVLAWCHGEKGQQRVIRAEAGILTSIVLKGAVVLVAGNPFHEPGVGAAHRSG